MRLDRASRTIDSVDDLNDPASLLIASVVLCHFCAWRTMAARHGHDETPYLASARLERRKDGSLARLVIRVSGPPRKLLLAAARGCHIAAALNVPVKWLHNDPQCATEIVDC